MFNPEFAELHQHLLARKFFLTLQQMLNTRYLELAQNLERYPAESQQRIERSLRDYNGVTLAIYNLIEEHDHTLRQSPLMQKRGPNEAATENDYLITRVDGNYSTMLNNDVQAIQRYLAAHSLFHNLKKQNQLSSKLGKEATATLNAARDSLPKIVRESAALVAKFYGYRSFADMDLDSQSQTNRHIFPNAAIPHQNIFHDLCVKAVRYYSLSSPAQYKQRRDEPFNQHLQYDYIEHERRQEVLLSGHRQLTDSVQPTAQAQQPLAAVTSVATETTAQQTDALQQWVTEAKELEAKQRQKDAARLANNGQSSPPTTSSASATSASSIPRAATPPLLQPRSPSPAATLATNKNDQSESKRSRDEGESPRGGEDRKRAAVGSSQPINSAAPKAAASAMTPTSYSPGSLVSRPLPVIEPSPLYANNSVYSRPLPSSAPAKPTRPPLRRTKRTLGAAPPLPTDMQTPPVPSSTPRNNTPKQ